MSVRAKSSPFEQERSLPRLRQRTGRAIAEIQPSGMAALAEAEKSVPCDPREILVMGDDLNVQTRQ